MINKYVWDLYLRSGGQEIVDFFERNLSQELSDSYAEEIARLQRVYCAAASIVEETKSQLSNLYEDIAALELEPIDEEAQNAEEKYFDSIDDIFASLLKQEFECNSIKEQFDVFSSWIAEFSTRLSIFYPGIFVPYYYLANYNVLTLISDAFDIKLLELPKKSAYRARIWHYVELCKVFYHFRKENQLSPYELCAFLYDFAPHYVGGIDSYIIKDLPSPKAAFFVGGGGDNDDAEAENDQEMITRWQCSPDIRAGDMVVMYLRTPISSISSVWRSMSVGFIDPFFYYYRCCFIGNPVKIPRIPLQEIKEDPVLGKMPIVAKNMQGINGVELKPSQYNYIVAGSGIPLPKLEYVSPDNSNHPENEKAVEEKLIIPLLKLLGYSETDYVRQMYIAIGNHNHALIPDFVINPKSAGGHYSGFAIIEAKRSITSEKMLDEVKTQARSYAKQLGTQYSIIASMEKIWVTSSKDDYSQTIYEQTWEELKEADTFYALDKLIGMRNI